MYFRLFLIISPWKRAGPFIWTNLNPLHPRMLCAKFGWNWPSGSGEEVENRKSLQTDGQTDGRTDAGRKAIRKAHLSFQLRWANKNHAQSLFIQIWWKKKLFIDKPIIGLSIIQHVINLINVMLWPLWRFDTIYL